MLYIGTLATPPGVGSSSPTGAAPVVCVLVNERAAGADPRRSNVVVDLVTVVRLQVHLVAQQSHTIYTSGVATK